MIFKLNKNNAETKYDDVKGHTITILNKSALETPIPKFINTQNGYMNSVVQYGVKDMRYRGEVLVFNTDYTEMFLCYSKDCDEGDYYLPGGGAEPTNSLLEQVMAETEEEAGFKLGTIIHSGYQYIREFNGNYPEWHKEHLHPKGLVYEGYYTEMYYGMYFEQLKKEVVNEKDIDEYMRENGKFINIKDNWDKIRPEHKVIISQLMSV